MAEQSADSVSRQVALPTRIDHERRSSGSPEYERGTQSSCASTDNDNVPHPISHEFTVANSGDRG
jgi:hypothetical protein